MAQLNNHDENNLIKSDIDDAIANEEKLSEYQKVIRYTLGQWVKGLKNGQIKLQSTNDLKTLIEADLLLEKYRDS